MLGLPQRFTLPSTLVPHPRLFRVEAEWEERADLLAELGTSDREAVFLGGKLGFCKLQPRLAPAAEVEPLMDRGRRFGAVETRIGARAGEILDFDVKDGI